MFCFVFLRCRDAIFSLRISTDQKHGKYIVKGVDLVSSSLMNQLHVHFFKPYLIPFLLLYITSDESVHTFQKLLKHHGINLE